MEIRFFVKCFRDSVREDQTPTRSRSAEPEGGADVIFYERRYCISLLGIRSMGSKGFDVIFQRVLYVLAFGIPDTDDVERIPLILLFDESVELPLVLNFTVDSDKLRLAIVRNGKGDSKGQGFRCIVGFRVQSLDKLLGVPVSHPQKNAVITHYIQ